MADERFTALPTAEEYALFREAYAETYPVRPLMNAIDAKDAEVERLNAVVANLVLVSNAKSAECENLRSVALAARALVQSAHDFLARDDFEETAVSEPALTALESALEAAGYGMSEEEFEQGVAGEMDDDGCSACGHGLRYHFDDGAGNVFCRYTPDCECRHADGVTR